MFLALFRPQTPAPPASLFVLCFSESKGERPILHLRWSIPLNLDLHKADSNLWSEVDPSLMEGRVWAGGEEGTRLESMAVSIEWRDGGLEPPACSTSATALRPGRTLHHLCPGLGVPR